MKLSGIFRINKGRFILIFFNDNTCCCNRYPFSVFDDTGI